MIIVGIATRGCSHQPFTAKKENKAHSNKPRRRNRLGWGKMVCVVFSTCCAQLALSNRCQRYCGLAWLLHAGPSSVDR